MLVVVCAKERCWCAQARAREGGKRKRAELGSLRWWGSGAVVSTAATWRGMRCKIKTQRGAWYEPDARDLVVRSATATGGEWRENSLAFASDAWSGA